MTQTRHWTSADLEQFPDDGKRYEIIAGELFESKQAKDDHQYAGEELFVELANWSRQSRLRFQRPPPHGTRPPAGRRVSWCHPPSP